MVGIEQKIRFIHDIQSSQRDLLNSLEQKKIYPGKCEVESILGDLVSIRSALENKTINMDPKFKCVLNKRVYNFDLAKDEKNLVEAVSKGTLEFKQILEFYDLSEQSISEDIELVMWKGFVFDGEPNYMGLARVYCPMGNKDDLKIIDVTLTDGEFSAALKGNISSSRAFNQAKLFEYDVFFAKNAEKYPLMETAIPILGTKYCAKIISQRRGLDALH
ncbi:hypothetical protein HOK51_09365 [Candidatus Woesearchaeota archaeon]|jgi:hypothetical protein|nr:hypothetical protein [Candidatus Woesearchaeota archaeon]MBT6520037.1 hypothetical protein [Candidatus Woesearchaeota archaeon]MBT7368620.1 hypothetical protein [Candidatus Woesearchaeota archaeon]